MRLFTVSALALAAQTAQAYVNTSPFFMFSMATNFNISSNSQLSTAPSVVEVFSKIFLLCPTQYYILISQPGVTIKDFQSRKNTPSLAHYLSAETSKTRIILTDVVGAVDTVPWQRILQERCSAEPLDLDAASGAIPDLGDATIINLDFPAFSKSNRKQELMNHDAYLASLLEQLPSQDYTVLYTTTPRETSVKDEAKVYEMESRLVDVLHSDLKRDLSLHGLAMRADETTGNQTMIDGPLFDKYQFLSPGIFMGFTVGFVLLLILYVGVSALSSLQVTYAAFDKEQGQLSSKKTQ